MTEAATCERTLVALSHAYASAADRRDGAALAALFAPDGELVCEPAGDRYRGRAELERVVEALAPFEVTLHDVGTVHVEVAGDRATGEVTCAAHHVADAVDHVLRIRYHDDYARDPGGGWRIARRRLVVLWTERHPVRRPGQGSAERKPSASSARNRGASSGPAPNCS
jgi:uncharacterized protein (TIGR02246 family)